MSRRSRNVIFTIGLLLFCLLVFLDRTYAPVSQKPKNNIKSTSISDVTRYHDKKFIVIKVVDGDTLDIDTPDNNNEHTRIRLWGVDTPETEKSPSGQMYFGPEAKDFAFKLIQGSQVNVYLDEGNQTRGKYGRLLAYIQLPDGRFLNEALLSEGFAYADRRFRHSFYHKYLGLEAQARRNNKGLWDEVKRDQLPQWLQRKESDLLTD